MSSTTWQLPEKAVAFFRVKCGHFDGQNTVFVQNSLFIVIFFSAYFKDFFSPFESKIL